VNPDWDLVETTSVEEGFDQEARARRSRYRDKYGQCRHEILLTSGRGVGFSLPHVRHRSVNQSRPGKLKRGTRAIRFFWVTIGACPKRTITEST
jgi:hypothetical protein